MYAVFSFFFLFWLFLLHWKYAIRYMKYNDIKEEDEILKIHTAALKHPYNDKLNLSYTHSYMVKHLPCWRSVVVCAYE